MPRTPKRPTSVPAEAQWNPSEEEWQLGSSAPQKRGDPLAVGEWRYWRKDGALACVAQYDEHGALNGINTRYHPDGTLASQGEWRHGSRFGHFVFVQSEHDTPEPYPEDDGSWRVEFDATTNWSEENKRFFLKDGSECTSTGRPLASAFDLDALFDDASPVQFIEADGPRILHVLAEKREKPLTTLPEVLSLDTVFGYQDRHIAPFLRLINQTGIREFSNPDDRDSTLWLDRFRGDKGTGNLMEWFLDGGEGNYYEQLGQAFSGAFPIGHFGDSDRWYVGIYDRRDPDSEEHGYTPQIYLWDHDGHGFDQPSYGGLDDFLWHLSINEARSQERLSEDAAERAYAQRAVKPQENLPKTRFFYWRAHWLIQLMDTYSVAYGQDNRLRDLDEAFNAKLNTPIDDALHKNRLQTGLNLPPTALYTLWRYFWFGHEARLREALHAYHDAPAKLTRDCVALIEELLAGRNTLPGIPDVRALRDGFLALDLDPDRQTERQAEQAVEAAQRDRERAALAAEISALQNQSIDALIERAWDVVDDAESLKLLTAEIRKDASIAPLFAVLDWMERAMVAERASPTILVNDEVLADVGAWFEARDHRRIQPWLWSISTPAPTLLDHSTSGPSSIHPRLIEAALWQLGIAEEYNHRRTRAAALLGRAQEPRAIPGLLALFDEFHRAAGERRGFELRLAVIPWEDCLTAAGVALEKILRAHPEAASAQVAECMHAIVSDYHGESGHEGHMMRKATVACLRTLGLLDDPRALAAIDSQRMMGENDDEFVTGLLLALRELARKHPESRDQIAQVETSRDHWTVLLAHALMRNAAIEDFDIDDAMAHIEESGDAPYGDDDWLEYGALLCEAVAETTLSTDLIADFVYSEHRQLREAAFAALRTRNVETPKIRALSPIEAEALVAEHGIEGILNALRDPKTIGLHYVLNTMQPHPKLTDDRFFTALIEAIERDLERLPERVDAGLQRQTQGMLEALRPYAENEAVIDLVARGLVHPSESLILATLPLAQPGPHAEAVVQALEELDSHPASYAAQWLITHADHHEVKAAIKAADLTVKKIAKLAR
jgi:hypothetical protein